YPLLTPSFFLRTRAPPSSTLFPYTTLFRSDLAGGAVVKADRRRPDLFLEFRIGLDRDRPLERRQLPEHARAAAQRDVAQAFEGQDRKSTRLNSSHVSISYAVFCLKKKKIVK